MTPAPRFAGLRPALVPGGRHPRGARRAAGAGARSAVPARPGLRRAVPPGPGDRAGRATATPARTDPTRRGLEAAIGELEGGDALVFASGQAAITALLLAVLRPGDTVLLPADGYFTVRAFAAATLRELGVTPVYAPTAGPYPSFDGVRLVLLETPANPGLDVCDITRRGRRRARRRRAGRGRQHRGDAARAAAAGARRRRGGRLRHQGADRALRPAARLRGDELRGAARPVDDVAGADRRGARGVRRVAGAPVAGHAGPAAGPAEPRTRPRSPRCCGTAPTWTVCAGPGWPATRRTAVAVSADAPDSRASSRSTSAAPSGWPGS